MPLKVTARQARAYQRNVDPDAPPAPRTRRRDYRSDAQRAVPGMNELRERVMKKATERAVREQLAELAHSQWSGWMDYLFSKCTPDADGGMRIPCWAVERWTRQAQTPYAELPENEKDSDRAEADRMLSVIHGEPR